MRRGAGGKSRLNKSLRWCGVAVIFRKFCMCRFQSVGTILYSWFGCSNSIIKHTYGRRRSRCLVVESERAKEWVSEWERVRETRAEREKQQRGKREGEKERSCARARMNVYLSVCIKIKCRHSQLTFKRCTKALKKKASNSRQRIKRKHKERHREKKTPSTISQLMSA